jgi:hypothetical protein
MNLNLVSGSSLIAPRIAQAFLRRAPNLDTVVVRDFCLSACANSFFPLGSKRRVVEDGAILGWHGGPPRDPNFVVEAVTERFDMNKVQTDVNERKAFENDLTRSLNLTQLQVYATENVLKRFGIDVNILYDTWGVSVPDICKDGTSSYAMAFVDKGTLERTYGFSGLEMRDFPLSQDLLKAGKVHFPELCLFLLPKAR